MIAGAGGLTRIFRWGAVAAVLALAGVFLPSSAEAQPCTSCWTNECKSLASYLPKCPEAAPKPKPQPPPPPKPAPRPEKSCPDGQLITVDTAGNCCWPGQAWEGKRCVGVPTSCPTLFEVNRRKQACTPVECSYGKVRMRDGLHCCWPGQAWSISQNACIGLVTKCPEGSSPDENQETCRRTPCDEMKVIPASKVGGCEEDAAMDPDPVRGYRTFKRLCLEHKRASSCIVAANRRAKDVTDPEEPTPAQLLEYACGYGDADGCFNLAETYDRGDDHDDKIKAAEAAEKACRLRGQSPCDHARLILLRHFEMSRLEAECKDKGGKPCRYLGDFYRHHPAHPDEKKAKQLYMRACLTGQAIACTQ